MASVTAKYPQLPWNEIFEFAEKYHVEAELIAAIAIRESSGNQYACRYEPRWSYWVDPPKWANELGCTAETERMGQATSYGYMQIMGSVARELGFREWFGKLYRPDYNINLGAAKLAKLLQRYRDPFELLAAYNAGSPRRGPDGKLVNQLYVERVVSLYRDMKAS